MAGASNLKGLLYVGGASLGLTFVVVLVFLGTYQKALKTGRNSPVMKILGRKLSSTILGYLQVLIKSSSFAVSKYDERMIAEARQKIRALEKIAIQPGGVCFTGSSTFTYWLNLNYDMRQVGPVFNAAFGGACTGHLLAVMDDLVVRHKPKAIVYYCGTNNIAYGEKEPDVIINDFKTFVQRACNALPHVKFVFLSLIPTPRHKSNGEERVKLIQAVNDKAKRYADSKSDMITFADCSSLDFVHDATMYLNDSQHFTPQGHKELAQFLTPIVQRVIA